MSESEFGATTCLLGPDSVDAAFSADLSRRFVNAVMVLGAVGAVLFAVAAIAAPLWQRLLVSASCAGLALVAGLLNRRPLRARLSPRAAVLAAVSGCLLYTSDAADEL